MSSAEQRGTDNYQTDPSSPEEGYDMLTHAKMRGMFYRNEITREELYQLENQWASALGRPLPLSALERARERARAVGFRFWYWHEQQSMHATQLMELAQQRAADFKAQAQGEPATLPADESTQ